MRTSSSPACGRHRSVRAVIAGALIGLLSLGSAAPASAGPGLGAANLFPVAASAFTVAPAIGAPIGNSLVLWGNGAATATVDLPGPMRRLVFEAIAQRCGGLPRLEVRVDGVPVFGREIAGRGSYAVAGSWARGRHKLSFGFPNNRLSAGCDRNIKIRSIGWWSPHPQFGATEVPVSQDLDMRAVRFSPASTGSGFTGGATLWSTGALSGRLDSQAGSYLHVRVRADACEGMPRFRMWVDGTLVTEQQVRASSIGSVSEHYVSGKWANATHTIEISYLNDVRTATCDRNLTVLSLSFSGSV